jgi:hypothetical protein
MTCGSNHKLAVAMVGAWWMSNVGARAKAFHYGRAAQRDECNGFPYAAAMEWRKVAELVPPNTRAAEYSWGQWERIMRLPRQLAGPIGVSPMAALMERASTTQPGMRHAIDKLLFATAA